MLWCVRRMPFLILHCGNCNQRDGGHRGNPQPGYRDGVLFARAGGLLLWQELSVVCQGSSKASAQKKIQIYASVSLYI